MDTMATEAPGFMYSMENRRLILQDDPLRGNARGGQTAVHTFGFRDLLAGTLSAGHDGNGIGIGVEIGCGGIDPLAEHEGWGGAVDLAAENDEVIGLRIRGAFG